MANSTELKPNYQMLAQSITENLANWSKEMKYLVPALAIFLSTVIAKHPQYAIKWNFLIRMIVRQLMNQQMRMVHIKL